MDRHNDLHAIQDDPSDFVCDITSVFEKLEIPISNDQLSAATLAFCNRENAPRQLWAVDAGKGKSRIHAGITILALKHTKDPV